MLIRVPTSPRFRSLCKKLSGLLALALASGISRSASADVPGSASPRAEPPVVHAPEPAPALASAPPARVDSRPIRAQRRWAIAGELGWNGLAGLGADLSFHPSPYFALDTGLGLGLAGLKTGLRARANLLSSAWTPLVGLGILYEGGAPRARAYRTRGESAMVKITGSPYAQLVGGLSYTGADGFTFMATCGYAVLLKDNAKYVSGSRTTYDDVRRLVAGGPVVAAAFGYAF